MRISVFSQEPCRFMRVCLLLTYICLASILRCMVRTTLILEESCLEAIRNLAHEEGKTLSETTNELLAEGLQRRKAKRELQFELPAFHMGKPRVNLGDRNALEALMDS